MPMHPSLRAFRLIRLLRILKLHRYSEAFTSIWTVIKKKSHEMFAAMFFVFMLLIVASLLIYYAEHEAQPDKFPNAFSGLWWAVATLTTVGYGDIYPITAIGRILGAFIAIMGIGMVAIPSGILSAGFVEMIEKKKQPNQRGDVVVEQETAPDEDKKQFCPYCGKKLYCPCCGEKLYCQYCGKKQ